jgi:hypothetical protein
MWIGQKALRSSTETPSCRDPATAGAVVACLSVVIDPRPLTPGIRNKPDAGDVSGHVTPFAVHVIRSLVHGLAAGSGGRYGVA